MTSPGAHSEHNSSAASGLSLPGLGLPLDQWAVKPKYRIAQLIGTGSYGEVSK